MSQAALVLSLILPLALAGALWLRGASRLSLQLAPWAAAPAFFLALSAPDFRLDIPWLLLGAGLGVDETRRIFLLLTAGLWTAAGVYAGAYHARDPRRRRYFTFHLVTLAGNLALVVALDAASFYLGFVVMSFAAYGMVVHPGSDEARRAARVYIVLVLIGEAMILPGLWSAVAKAPTTALPDVAAAVIEAGPLTFALIALGFGVKAGVVPLHLWLPLAHPVAPTPASAVLSGAMIKAGVLAWVGLLPVGLTAMESAALLFIVGGFVNALFGALVGICQARPKTVLAYSSISQIGFIMIAFGAAFTSAEAAPAAIFVTALYCLHHGAAKGALFLGVGVVERTSPGRARNRWLALLAVPALALAGAPLTTGFGAKLLVKEGAYGLDWPFVEPLLGLAAVGTTLLMIRFLTLMARAPAQRTAPPPAMAVPLAALVAAGLAAAWIPDLGLAAGEGLTDPAALWSGLWPLLGGLAIAAFAALLAHRGMALPAIPEGDIVDPLGRVLGAAGRHIGRQDVRRIAWARRRGDAVRPRVARLRRRAIVRGLRLEQDLALGIVVALNLLAILGGLIVLTLLG